jgi:hypothetical protein
MIHMHIRAYLRCLSPAQRRAWVAQRRRLTPRVAIGSAHVPHRVARSFVYIKVA